MKCHATGCGDCCSAAGLQARARLSKLEGPQGEGHRGTGELCVAEHVPTSSEVERASAEGHGRTSAVGAAESAALKVGPTFARQSLPGQSWGAIFGTRVGCWSAQAPHGALRANACCPDVCTWLQPEQKASGKAQGPARSSRRASKRDRMVAVAVTSATGWNGYSRDPRLAGSHQAALRSSVYFRPGRRCSGIHAFHPHPT